jgi:hypothetical protein
MFSCAGLSGAHLFLKTQLMKRKRGNQVFGLWICRYLFLFLLIVMFLRELRVAVLSFGNVIRW